MQTEIFTHFVRLSLFSVGVFDILSSARTRKKKLGYRRKNSDIREKILTSKKKLKRIDHYPVWKIKPSCDEEITYPLTYLFVTICGLRRINQSECSLLLGNRRNQPIMFTTFESQYQFVTLLLFTSDTRMIHLLTCDQLVIHSRLTCDPLVALLLLACNW